MCAHLFWSLGVMIGLLNFMALSDVVLEVASRQYMTFEVQNVEIDVLWAAGRRIGRCAWPGSQFGQEVDDFGRTPVDGTDEFAPNDAPAIDDVGFGEFETAVEIAALVVGVADG
jgi:hypothetical protein